MKRKIEILIGIAIFLIIVVFLSSSLIVQKTNSQSLRDEANELNMKALKNDCKVIIERQKTCWFGEQECDKLLASTNFFLNEFGFHYDEICNPEFRAEFFPQGNLQTAENIL